MKYILCFLAAIFLQGCAKAPIKAGNIYSVEELGFHIEGEKFIAIDQHLLLTNKGNVYSLNSGYDKRRWKGVDKDLYLGRNTRSFIGKIDFLKDIKKILVANNSFLALTSSGEVYSWGGSESISLGRNCSSQLGSKLVNKQKLPLKISGSHKVVDINYFSCISSYVTETGDVFRWGYKNLFKGRLFERSSAIYAKKLKGSIQFELLEPQVLDIPVNTKFIGYRSLVSQSGEIFMLLTDISAEKLSRYLKPVSRYVYKFKSNNKAVRQSFGSILLDDNSVLVLPATMGTDNRITEVIPEKYFTDVGKVELLSRQSLVTSEGDVYRWGGISYEFSKGLSFPSTTSTRIIKSDEPVYIETQNEKIIFFSRDAYITRSGEVYLYGSSEMNHPVSIYGEALKYAGYTVSDDSLSKDNYHRVISLAKSNLLEE